MIDPKLVIKAVKCQAENLQIHYKTLDILEGNLEPYLLRALQRQLSPKVFTYAVERMVPINILPRYIEKLSNIYQTGVSREVQGGDQTDADLLSWYEDQLDIDVNMHLANKLFNACGSSLIYPYMGDDGPDLRVIPNDRFVVWSDDAMEPTEPTMVILIAGQTAEGLDIYWVYTDEEFAVIKSDESYDLNAMAEMGIPDGINPYGVLPFTYINSSPLRLWPIPDKDTLRITEFIPVALTDLNLAAMFSAFSINYMINGSSENLTYAPNALWFLKSDDPEKEVQIGTLKPQVDYQEVLNLIQSELSLWLGTKGIKSGSVGQVGPDSAASGIAKIIDESDTFDVRQEQTVHFSCGEQDLWELILRFMHPVWIARGEVENRTMFSPSAEIDVKFSITPVGTQRAQLIQDQRDEYAAGFTTRQRAIAALNPQMTSEQVDMLIQDVDGERSLPGDANVLNGAQVTSAVDILTAAAIGTIPRDSAVQLMMQAFGWDIDQANALLSTIGQGFVPSSVQGNVTINPQKEGQSNGNQMAASQDTTTQGNTEQSSSSGDRGSNSRADSGANGSGQGQGGQ